LVAEIGKNFIQTKKEQPTEEYLKKAKELVEEAKEAGADAVKFQTHFLEDEQLDLRVSSPHFKAGDRYNWVKRNTLATPLWFWQELQEFCRKMDILFFSTPMSRGAAQILEKINVPLWKVGSADILDFVMLDFICQTRKPVIISTGMSSLKEIDQAVGFLKEREAPIVLMHCVSKYPCPKEELSLGMMSFLQERYGLPVGFSDHSITVETAVAASQLGAWVIEKHFTSSRNLWGADHKSSLLPEEFKKMAEMIRGGERLPLKGYRKIAKQMVKGEEAFRPLFRKSLVAGRNLEAGVVLGPEMIYAMRPQGYAGGLPSERYQEVLGKKLKKGLKKYQPISLDILEI